MTNDTLKFGPATQVRELRDDELQEVSGGVYTFGTVAVNLSMAYVLSRTSADH